MAFNLSLLCLKEPDAISLIFQLMNIFAVVDSFKLLMTFVYLIVDLDHLAWILDDVHNLDIELNYHRDQLVFLFDYVCSFLVLLKFML